MRRVDKSQNIPASLVGLTPPASPSKIDPALYKGADVKQQLKEDQHSKCVYCECKLNGDYGHVEHFRPKGGYTIPPSNALKKPGYYWLAYEWSNLLLSCSICNTSYKQNHFALEDESQRDIAHQNISNEVSLLINPSAEDPSIYIEFHQHIVAPKIINGKESVKGRHTIELLKLNERMDLVENRRETWEKFKKWETIRKVAKEMIETPIDIERGKKLLALADESIARMKDAASEYSAMFSMLTSH